jgi:hypothetical protein
MSKRGARTPHGEGDGSCERVEPSAIATESPEPATVLGERGAGPQLRLGLDLLAVLAVGLIQLGQQLGRLVVGLRRHGECFRCLRERKTAFSPEMVSEFAELLKSYRVTSISGDRYAGVGRKKDSVTRIRYEAAQKPKSDLYRDLLPAINSRKIDLLDHPRLLTQLVGLERRTARGGRDSIDHAPGAHDDLANAVAGLCGCTRRKYAYPTSMSWVS